MSVFGDKLEMPEEIPTAFGGEDALTVTSGGVGEDDGVDDASGREDVAPSPARRTGDSRSMALQSLRDFTDF